MWKGPSSEAGYSYPETAVTSRIAESISETELNFFMSKIAMLEEEVRTGWPLGDAWDERPLSVSVQWGAQGGRQRIPSPPLRHLSAVCGRLPGRCMGAGTHRCSRRGSAGSGWRRSCTGWSPAPRQVARLAVRRAPQAGAR